MLRRYVIVGVMAATIALCLQGQVSGQTDRDDTRAPTYGNRPIDDLPKPGYARAEDYQGWDEPDPPERHELKVHLKDRFRVGDKGIERLCVVEARRPEGAEGGHRLSAVQGEYVPLLSMSADWIGANQRMRPYW